MTYRPGRTRNQANYLRALEYAQWILSHEQPEDVAGLNTLMLSRALVAAEEDLRVTRLREDGLERATLRGFPERSERV